MNNRSLKNSLNSGLFLCLLLLLGKNVQASSFNAGLLTNNEESLSSLGFSFVNDRESEEKAGDSNGSWGIDLRYLGFQNKKNTDDRSQGLTTAFRETSESLLELNLGITFSSASLERISLSEPFLAVGKTWSLTPTKETDWIPTVSVNGKIAHGSISQVESANAASLSRDYIEVKLDTFYWENIRLHLDYQIFKYSEDLGPTAVNNSASRNIAHPEGPIFNSLYTLPSEYRSLGLDLFYTSSFLQLAFAQAREKISGLYSQNINLQFNKHINNSFGMSVGLGNLQSSDGVSTFGSTSITYQF
jgi:hypothetical protein